MYNKKEPKPICDKCADKAGLNFFLLSPKVAIGKCYMCKSKYNLVNYAVLEALNK